MIHFPIVARISFIPHCDICLPKGRHSEAAHEKRFLCAQKCTRGGVGWVVGNVGVGWGESCRDGMGWVM